MKITVDDAGNVTIEMDNPDEALGLADDLADAATEPGCDIEQDLISEDGVSTLIVRCGPAVDDE